MENIEKPEKMVSIIIPVYNAEKYLGYCINSVVSQTYRNIELILVNDGSMDKSLEICENYARIDKRVRVITIPNGGVSNARNTGIKVASGEYIQFVDSDDIIKLDMTERLVKLMETYEKDMVICGFDMITLNGEQKVVETIPFSSGFLGKECVLTREVFFKKMAYILWRSSLLECPWNKMFRRDILLEHEISFPSDMSLGEDFCFNMDYFQYINGVVLVEDEYYYYMQMNQEALTRKYREDLFENQLYLVQKFETLLRNNVEISEEEKTEFAEYVIAKMLQSICNLFNKECRLNPFEKKAKIAEIINHPYVRKFYKRANYIEPKYEVIRQKIEFSDVQGIYEEMEKLAKQRNETALREDASDETVSESVTLKRGILNRILVGCCNVILKIHKITVIEKLRDLLCWFGIKYTLRLCWKKIKKK